MLQVKQNRAAFTLIELLVVVIIVAVLAAVGVPLLSANVERARASEAEAGLGAVRTALRAMQAEIGAFPTLANGPVVGTNRVSGIGANDLTGRWVEDDDYTVASAAGTGYCITVNPDAGGAEGIAQDGDNTNNTQSDTIVTRAMDENGTIFMAPATCPN